MSYRPMLGAAAFGFNEGPTATPFEHMPNITLSVPAQAFDAGTRQRLLQAIHDAAVVATGIGPDPRQQALCWVMLHEVAQGQWGCGGRDASAHCLPVQVQVLAPHGVLDALQRADYAQQLHQAIASCLAADEPRTLLTSIVIDDVADGRWAANGRIWHLADFVQAAGYAHLQPTAAIG
ncbi:tautomerase family protein [Bacillus subtilis subsp. subtilis]|nr:tautomerase family protein [Bacillus subtilis subsp. subtilis]